MNNEAINGWTKKKEELLEKWKFESSLYIWLHNYNAEYYKMIDKMFNIPALIINAITSTTIFSTLNMDNNKNILISMASLLILGTVLQSLRDFLNLSKLIHSNVYVSKQYQILINNINEQLNQEPPDRINGVDFIDKINKERNGIVLDSPYINNKSWQKLTIKIKNGSFILLENNIYFRKYFNELREQQQKSNIDQNPENHNPENNNQIHQQNNTIIDISNNNNIDLLSNNLFSAKYDLENISIEALKNKLKFHNNNI